MKQLLQSLSTGQTEIVDAPAPSASPSAVVVRTRVSLISSGTERMVVEFGRANLIDKARQQPEKVREVLDRIRTNGLASTLEAVRSKLDQPVPLGYCNVGVLADVHPSCTAFKVGDRVVSNGSHAEVVRVPTNLCARVPENVDDESAAFAVLGSIALQGIRLASPTLGERFVVIGAGLIGLLAVQILRAHGCEVLAVDFDAAKLALARGWGAQVCELGQGPDPVAAGMAFSQGRGVDGVIIAASTSSSDPVSQAARMCRRRGRIVLVGVTGLELNRAEFYDKELSFQVSCSYGPGRYDPAYEQQGRDYPLGFVRWTAQRNFEAVLGLMASGRLDVRSLIARRVSFDDAGQAYSALLDDKGGLGILLTYPRSDSDLSSKTVRLKPPVAFRTDAPVLGVVGAGNYSSRVTIPALKAFGAQLHTILTTGGPNGVVHGRKAGFEVATSDERELFDNQAINAVMVVTRHDSHSSLVSKALDAGKHVFVEKPLAIDRQGLADVMNAYERRVQSGTPLQVMVGFNRRFAPQVERMHALLSKVPEPRSIIITVNAGAIPVDHWMNDPGVGGGRVIGEACHFIDLARFLAGGRITQVHSLSLGESNGRKSTEDKVTLNLAFEDGSVAAIHYLANGAQSFPKERVEVFCSGGVLQLDNFRKLTGFGWPGFRSFNLWSQDKGQKAVAKAFLDAIQSGQPAIPFDQILEVAEATLTAAEQLRDS